MREALRDADIGRQQRGGRKTVGAVIVDPSTNAVVASASRERRHVTKEETSSCAKTLQDHPLRHPTMRCVNWVGRALVAGKAEALQQIDQADGQEAKEGNAGGKLPTAGIKDDKHQERVPDQDLGSTDEEPSTAAGEDAMGVENVGPKQYLCTGFDLYITQEPCLM